jgi:hypothetical protein
MYSSWGIFINYNKNISGSIIFEIEMFIPIYIYNDLHF